MHASAHQPTLLLGLVESHSRSGMFKSILAIDAFGFCIIHIKKQKKRVPHIPVIILFFDLLCINIFRNTQTINFQLEIFVIKHSSIIVPKNLRGVKSNTQKGLNNAFLTIIRLFLVPVVLTAGHTQILIRQDNVKTMYALVDAADIIVYAFPFYGKGVPGILKTFNDRGLYRYYPHMIRTKTATRHPKRFRNKQSMVIFSVCGFSEKNHFKAVDRFFRQTGHNADISVSNTIYRSACMYLCVSPFQYKLIRRLLIP